MPNKNQNIFLVGPSGAGKSTIGMRLAKKLQWQFYDSDKVIESRSGVSISWMFEIEGEAAFRERETKAIDELTSLKNIVLATGAGAILTPSNRHYLSSRGTVLYFHASVDTLATRVVKNLEHRPLLQVANVNERINKMLVERRDLYSEIADLEIVTEGREMEEIVNGIIEACFGANYLS